MRRLIIAVALGGAVLAAAPRRITLEEARDLARRQNSALKLARLKVDESEQQRLQARADYFPKVQNDSNWGYFFRLQRLEISRGALGVYPSAGPIPGANIDIPLGLNNIFLSQTSVGQPVTQLFKVRAGVGAAAAGKAANEAQVRRAEEEVLFAVEQLFAGALIAQQRTLAAEAASRAAQTLLDDARRAVESGNQLKVAVIGRTASLLEAKQKLLAAEAARADCVQMLNDLLGLPLDTELELVEPAAPAPPFGDRDAAVARAQTASPEVAEAVAAIDKARHGVAAARADYLPDVTLFAQHVFQHGVPLLASNNGLLGGRLSYTLFEFGKKEAKVRERETQLKQAEENLRRVRSRVAVEVEKSWRKAERMRQLMDVAQQALDLRSESARIAADQVEAGVAARAVLEEARAAEFDARASLTEARLGWRVAVAELVRNAGGTM